MNTHSSHLGIKKPLPTGGKAVASTALTREEREFGEAGARSGVKYPLNRLKVLCAPAIDRISGGLLFGRLTFGNDVPDLVGAKRRDFIAPGVNRLHRQSKRLGQFPGRVVEQLKSFFGSHSAHIKTWLNAEMQACFSKMFVRFGTWN